MNYMAQVERREWSLTINKRGKTLISVCGNSIHFNQAKFAIGDLQTAKKYTLQAVAAEPQAKFEDEKRAAKDARELMLKINAILADSK